MNWNWLQILILIVTALLAGPVIAAGVSALKDTMVVKRKPDAFKAQLLFACALLGFGLLLFASGSLLIGVANG